MTSLEFRQSLLKLRDLIGFVWMGDCGGGSWCSLPPVAIVHGKKKIKILKKIYIFGGHLRIFIIYVTY